MNIRYELHIKDIGGGRYVKPHACYTLDLNERQQFCSFLESVKFPDGFASNISRGANKKDGKLSGLKSHDCHILLQRLLPIGVRGFLRQDVHNVLVELSCFFNILCSRTLYVKDLEAIRENIVFVLCKMERIFPPAFFDIMIHLAVHLPHAALIAGPVTYIERFLRTPKGYVRNKARPEGSIAKAYISKECLTFCSMYLQGLETKFNRQDRNYDYPPFQQYGVFKIFIHRVRPLGSTKYISLAIEDYDRALWYVLHNCEEIQSYFEEHLQELMVESRANISQRQQK
ncbi:hypothetical protein Scep_029587 [Stephania cephalantha]|uniref:DUF4218 domain-containing protein n=1 Tax=Stephania cephalantha TaxID=152367 RepID=A0AAP0HG18_9MAGN